MPYFEAPNNSLHFLTDDDITNGWLRVLPDGCERLTDEQAAKLIAFLKANPDIVAAAQL